MFTDLLDKYLAAKAAYDKEVELGDRSAHYDCTYGFGNSKINTNLRAAKIALDNYIGNKITTNW